MPTPEPSAASVDPVCLVHGKRRSEHACLYCCLCFNPLTPEECHEDADGVKWDVCDDCARMEAMAHAAQCGSAAPA